MRTYGEACAAAHALDLVGARWALLVVRELLLGPKRFADLERGMRHASPRVLSQRLRELEEAGVVGRRKLGPPSGAWVYHLTRWGMELEPVLIQLGRWGRQSPSFEASGAVSVDALMLALRSRFDPQVDPELSVSFEVRFGEDLVSVQVSDCRLTIRRGEAVEPDTVVETDPATFAALLTRRLSVSDAQKKGQLELSGNGRAVSRFFSALPRHHASSSLSQRTTASSGR